MTDAESSGVGSEEGNEDEGAESDQSTNQNLDVTELCNKVSVQKSTKERTNTSSVTDTSLPSSRKLIVASGLIPASVLLCEAGIGPEIAEKVCIVAFHNDAHGNDKTPQDGSGISADGFEGREVMFGDGSLCCTISGMLTDCLDSGFGSVVLGVHCCSLVHFLGHGRGRHCETWKSLVED